MQRWKNDKQVDGLLFNYLHFYGSYDYVGDAYNWYRREIRIVRSNKSIYSYRDAQGFRKEENQKLRVKPIDAWIYHYGWVKSPKTMVEKKRDTSKFYHTDEWVAEHFSEEQFDYSQIDALRPFTGTHPQVMQERISNINWAFEHDPSFNRLSPKDRFRRIVENLTGYRPFEYKNYKII